MLHGGEGGLGVGRGEILPSIVVTGCGTVEALGPVGVAGVERRHDVVEPILLEVDRVFHLACPASPIHYQTDPVQTTKTSVHGAINVLGLAKRLGCKIFQASTSEVYGDPTVHPQVESYRGNVTAV